MHKRLEHQPLNIQHQIIEFPRITYCNSQIKKKWKYLCKRSEWKVMLPNFVSNFSVLLLHICNDLVFVVGTDQCYGMADWMAVCDMT